MSTPAMGDAKKTVYAPYNCTVVSLLDSTEAHQVMPGQPLLLLSAGGQEQALKAMVFGMIVYIPVKPGMAVNKGHALVYLL